ncbi:MAG: hypothetical protein J6W36_03200 [Clostridiales bacterium]|nr:hypothetical protein [Clostridiales bacterium]
MLEKEYPAHDINTVFDLMESTIEAGGTDEKARDELLFLNHLFAALPAEAVEYGMMFLHGERNLPESVKEIVPLFIRLVNLAEYCEKVDKLREIPSKMTVDEALSRKAMMDSLDEHEKAFGKPLLGYQFNSKTIAEVPEKKDGGEEDNTDNGRLLLMNSQAAVFVCPDPYKTSIFYETKLGFKAAHLDDESMPHIRLMRDNIAIVLVKGTGDIARPLRKFGIKYDMYIYCSEPYLLQNELMSQDVKIIEPLPDAQEAKQMNVNRQFVFEDCDGRHICASQYLESFEGK